MCLLCLTADMSTGGVHRGFLRKYGGFKLFKQWKERYLVLTVEGSLRVCRDAESPPDQVVALQWNCEAIVEGREILDLPRLPPGGRRDCCFALILPQEKFLLLLADSPEDCRMGVQPGRMVPAQRSWSPVYLLGPGYPAPALRTVSPVRLHSPVRPVLALRTCRAQMSILPGRIVPALRFRSQVRFHSPPGTTSSGTTHQTSSALPQFRTSYNGLQSSEGPQSGVSSEGPQSGASSEGPHLWLKLIRKVREGVMSTLVLQRQQSLTPSLTAHITDRDPQPDTPTDRDTASPRATVSTSTPTATPTGTPTATPTTTPSASRAGSFRDNSLGKSGHQQRDNSLGGGHRQSVRSVRSVASVAPPHRTSDCLRHGNSSDARAVRAVCLLMGGAAASSALGYLQSCSPSSPLTSRASGLQDLGPLGHGGGAGSFSEMGGGSGGSFHCSQDVDNPPQFNSFDFEGGDSDFDAFDCGGFAF
ncbi:uncharacterized protein LOC115127313 [Oncorhynchus nerka]|uniref:uncharacterized protein LOC115127313 n=1 Tax=Oncorhynchus nerka TaxID=8023 RepID=UPI0031B82799